MNDVRFSIIIHAKNTDVELFKNAMRNLQKVSYLYKSFCKKCI